MKNIFKYATKELSQDAVLSWLFASWEDKELQPLVLNLLNEFGVNITADDIIDIQPLLKICKIDITIALVSAGALAFGVIITAITNILTYKTV